MPILNPVDYINDGEDINEVVTNRAIEDVQDNVELLNQFIEDQLGSSSTIGVIYPNEGETLIQLPFTYIEGSGSLHVFRNGVRLVKDVDYFETNDQNITLNSPAGAIDTVVALKFNVLAIGVADASNVTYELGSVADALNNLYTNNVLQSTVSVNDGDTIVVVPIPYKPLTNTLMVFADGVMLPKSAYNEQVGQIELVEPNVAEKITFAVFSFNEVAVADAANISDVTRGQSVQDTLDQLSSIVTETVPVTAGQTVITPNIGFVVGYTRIYVNGFKFPDGFTLNSPTIGDIEFAEELPDGVVEVETYIPRELGTVSATSVVDEKRGQSIQDTVDQQQARFDELDDAIDQAEAARDAALVNANIYPDEATGRAAVADGESFLVENADDAIAADAYRRVDASTSEFLFSYPASAGIDEIGISSGLVSLYPDPLFKIADGDKGYQFATGRRAIHSGHGNATWVLDKSNPFNTHSWEVNAGGSLLGFDVWFDLAAASLEHNIQAGDTISLAAIVSGSAGRTIRGTFRFFQTTASNYITGQEHFEVVATGSPQTTSSESIVVPVDADGLEVYFYDTDNQGAFNVLSFWVAKGVNAGKWPPAKQSNLEASLLLRKNHPELFDTPALENAVSNLQTMSNGDIELTGDVVFSSGVPQYAKDYSSTFAGWADPFEWDGVSFDAVKVYVAAERANTPIKVTIWTGDGLTDLASGYAISDYRHKDGAWMNFRLDRRVFSDSAQILYVSVESEYGVSRLASMAFITGYSNVPDVETYPQFYTTTVAPGATRENLTAWSDVAANIGHPLAFELYDTAKVPMVSRSDKERNFLLGEVLEERFDLTNPIFEIPHSGGYKPITSTFSGWAQPFDWDGTPFNLVKFGHSLAEAGKPILVTLWTADRQYRITQGIVEPIVDKGFSWVKLDRRVTPENTTDTTLYLTFESPYGEIEFEQANVSLASYVRPADDVTHIQYYTTTTRKDQELVEWAAVSADGHGRPFAFELHDLLNLLPKTVVGAGDITYFENPASTELVMTPRMYGIEGTEINVYPTEMHSANSFYIYDFASSLTGTKHLNEKWTMVPSVAEDLPLTITLHHPDELVTMSSATTQVKTVLGNAVAGASRKVLAIGDSTTNAGRWTQRLLDKNVEYPSGAQLELLGTRGSGANKHEGRGGWSVIRYYQPTGADVAENPFVENAGEKFNASYYLTSTAQAAPDIVIWHLGINDLFNRFTDADVNSKMDEFLAQLDEMIGVTVAADVGSWKEAAPNCKHIIAVPIPPAATQDAFGANYSDNQYRARYKRTILVGAHRLIEHYKNSESDGIFLLPWHCMIDPYNGFPFKASEPANSNTTREVERQNNGVHPDTGYEMMGDAAYAAINVLIDEGSV